MAKDCVICGGTGWVRYDLPVNHPYFGKIFPCKCMAPILAQRNREKLQGLSGLTMAELQAWTFDKFDPNKSVAPWQEDREKRVEETRVVRQQMEAIKRVCMEYADNPEGWLVLQGGYGSGKTMLACAIVNAQWEAGREAHYDTVPDILRMLRGGYNSTSDGFDERMNLLADVPLLVLDDLGAERGTDWANEQIYLMLNGRYRKKLPLVVTTNENLDTTEKIDPRIVSRLKQGTERVGGFCRLIHVPAGDLRPYV